MEISFTLFCRIIFKNHHDFFCLFFAIPLSSRHEIFCQMLISVYFLRVCTMLLQIRSNKLVVCCLRLLKLGNLAKIGFDFLFLHTSHLAIFEFWALLRFWNSLKRVSNTYHYSEQKISWHCLILYNISLFMNQ